MPKMSSICSAVSIQYRRVTDKETGHSHRGITNTALAQRHEGNTLRRLYATLQREQGHVCLLYSLNTALNQRIVREQYSLGGCDGCIPYNFSAATAAAESFKTSTINCDKEMGSLGKILISIRSDLLAA